MGVGEKTGRLKPVVLLLHSGRAVEVGWHLQIDQPGGSCSSEGVTHVEPEVTEQQVGGNK